MKNPDPTVADDAMPPEPENTSSSILSFADRLRDSRKEQPEKPQTFESWVSFRVANRHLALPVTHVREILRLTELTGVPNAPAPVAGVMNLRGHVLPVVDTHALLELKNPLATDRSRVLVCLFDNRPIGLVVDDVVGLERLQVELVQAVERGEPLAHVAKGSFAEGDREPLLLLEPAVLFAGKTATPN